MMQQLKRSPIELPDPRLYQGQIVTFVTGFYRDFVVTFRALQSFDMREALASVPPVTAEEDDRYLWPVAEGAPHPQMVMLELQRRGLIEILPAVHREPSGGSQPFWEEEATADFMKLLAARKP